MLSIGMFTYSTRPRGSVVHAACLAEALKGAGHDVTLYALGKDGTGFYRSVACNVTIFPAAEAPASREALVRQRIGEFVAGMGVRSLGHDILHAQDCLAASALLQARLGPSPPVVRTVHHVEAYADPYLAECQRRSIAYADAVFAVSRLTRREVLERFGRRSSLVPNGVDRSRFSGPNEPSVVRSRLGLDACSSLVVSIGGVEPRKNSVRALAAVAQALEEHPTMQWVVVGGDSLWDHSAYIREFEAALAALPPSIAARVRRTGPVAEGDLVGLLRAADVFFFPSRHEGFGLSVLEALAAGAAVVVPDREPFTEYLDERCAVFVDPESVDSMSAALIRLARDPNRGRAFAGEALATVSRWSWARSAAIHAAHYLAIASRAQEATPEPARGDAHA